MILTTFIFGIALYLSLLSVLYFILMITRAVAGDSDKKDTNIVAVIMGLAVIAWMYLFHVTH